MVFVICGKLLRSSSDPNHFFYAFQTKFSGFLLKKARYHLCWVVVFFFFLLRQSENFFRIGYFSSASALVFLSPFTVPPLLGDRIIPVVT